MLSLKQKRLPLLLSVLLMGCMPLYAAPIVRGQTVVTTIPVGSGPTAIATNSVTNEVYVSNYGDSTVSVINGGSNTVVATVPVGSGPEGIGQFVNKITNRIYVSSDSNSVTVIDGASNTVVTTILTP